MVSLVNTFLLASLAGVAIAAPMTGSNLCTAGPAHWCSSIANAKQCDFPIDGCSQYCNNLTEYPELKGSDVCAKLAIAPGANSCTQGPSYYCSSALHAKNCGVQPADCQKYCTADYPDILKGELCEPDIVVGTNPCTQGPSYFCASAANAEKCDMEPADCQKYCTAEYPDVLEGELCKPVMVGTNPCTQGPSYFCASAANAEACDVQSTDCQKYCNGDYPDVLHGDMCETTIAGTNPCTQGPSYFCASSANAEECNVEPTDCQTYCTADYPDVLEGDLCDQIKVGTNPCTQGPSYFCASAANAKECGMKPTQCQMYCTAEYPEVLTGGLCKPHPKRLAA